MCDDEKGEGVGNELWRNLDGSVALPEPGSNTVRWIATVDVAKGVLESIERIHWTALFWG